MVSAVSVWVTLSSCEATPPYLQQRNVVIGRRFTTSGEDMENNQQPTSTTTQYLWEQLQLWDAVVGRRFTTSGEGMENNQQPTTTTTPYLWEQLQLHNVVVGRRFTTSSEDMDSAQQLRSTTTVYLWQQVSCQTRYITSRLGCQVVQHNRVAKNEPAHSKPYLELGLHTVVAWRQQYDCKRRAQEQ